MLASLISNYKKHVFSFQYIIQSKQISDFRLQRSKLLARDISHKTKPQRYSSTPSLNDDHSEFAAYLDQLLILGPQTKKAYGTGTIRALIAPRIVNVQCTPKFSYNLLQAVSKFPEEETGITQEYQLLSSLLPLHTG
jgi:hypothetical protein